MEKESKTSEAESLGNELDSSEMENNDQNKRSDVLNDDLGSNTNEIVQETTAEADEERPELSTGEDSTSEEYVVDETKEEIGTADSEKKIESANTHEVKIEGEESEEQEENAIAENPGEEKDNAIVENASDKIIDETESKASDEVKTVDDGAHEEDDDQHAEEIDFSEFSKEELVNHVKSLAKHDDVLMADKRARQMAPYMEEMKRVDREEKLKSFIEEGGLEVDFYYKNDELTDRFEANIRLIHDRKVDFLKKRENEREKNYQQKLEVLEKLREFVDSEETNISFNQFKTLQDVWKNIGPVQPVHNKTLWASYNALVNRFYDNRTIYFELKELDRKRNLEAKIALCERAEQLKDVENLKDAITELNELHHDFKHIGPVPREDQEVLWERFKSASDEVYLRRKAFVDTLKKDLDLNYNKKVELCDKIQEFVSFEAERIRDWNEKTKEILDIQKKWEAIGGLPRSKARELNKKFWGSFKLFFNNKSNFFKKLDADKEGNLEKKKLLVEKAMQLKESEDWEETAEEYKKLQTEWKNIGPVPEKVRDKLYKEFKQACDYFFDKRREGKGSQELEYSENLKKKIAICEELETLAGTQEGTAEKLESLENDYYDIGFVPKNMIKKIRERYKIAVSKYLDKIKGLSEDDKESMLMENEINRLMTEPNANKKIQRMDQNLRKQISEKENDIALWKNNIEFFASSKKADALKDELMDKINKATEELNAMKQQLKLLRSAE